MNRLTVLVSVFALSALFSLSACDSGSRAAINTVDKSGCKVGLKSNSDGFAVEMLLECAGPGHTRCYTITELQCDGAKVPLKSPLPIKNCPGQEWCVDDCNSVDAPGTIWDTPALLKQNGCNAYKK